MASAAPALKTPEEHERYLADSIRLLLWFGHRWSKDHPAEDFRSILEERVDIFCKTDLNKTGLYEWAKPGDDPEWKRMMEQVLEIKASLGPDEHGHFEEKAFGVFKPRIKGRIDRDLEAVNSAEALKAGLKGPFWWDKKFLSEEKKAINFHIYNSLYPGSIFKDPLYLPRFFIVMLDESERTMGAKVLSTLTWLNNLDRWNGCFPSEWKSGMGQPDADVQGHLGFWGQIVTSRQTLNYSVCEDIRRTGRLPYPMIRSWCDFGSMRKHLAEKFGLRGKFDPLKNKERTQ